MSPYNKSNNNDSDCEIMAAAGVPLLADAGMVTEAPTTSRTIHRSDLSTLIRFTTVLGCLFGILAAVITIGVTQLIVDACANVELDEQLLNKLFLVFDVIWCLVVTILARFVMHYILVQSYHPLADSSNESLWQVLDLSMAIGTLTGVLVSGSAMCFFLGYGFWDKLMMVFGSIAMVILCAARAMCMDSEVLDDNEEEENKESFGIVTL